MEDCGVVCDGLKYMTNGKNESNSSRGSKEGMIVKGLKCQCQMSHIDSHKEEMQLHDLKVNLL